MTRTGIFVPLKKYFPFQLAKVVIDDQSELFIQAFRIIEIPGDEIALLYVFLVVVEYIFCGGWQYGG